MVAQGSLAFGTERLPAGAYRDGWRRGAGSRSIRSGPLEHDRGGDHPEILHHSDHPSGTRLAGVIPKTQPSPGVMSNGDCLGQPPLRWNLPSRIHPLW